MAKKKKKKKKKKKQKLNMKLLLIIALVVGGIGVIGGGALYYQGSWRATRNINSGLEAMKEGDYRLAKKYFGRVLYRQPDNVVVYDNLLKTYDHIVPVSQVEARELFNERNAVMMSRAKNLPASEENYASLIDEMYIAARITDREEYPRQILQICTEIERRFPNTSDLYAEAMLYKGLSTLRLRDAEMTDDLRIDGRIYFPGEEDLIEHIELVPGSDEGWAYLAFGRLAVARRLGLEGRVGQEAKNLQHANTTYKEAVAKNPDGPATSLMVLRDLYLQKIVQNGEIQNDRTRISQDEIDALEARLQASLDHVESIILVDPGSMPIKVQELLMYFRRVDFENGQDRAVALLNAYLADEPEDLRFRLALADLYYAMKNYDAASEAVSEVLGADQKPISLESLEQYDYRLTAASLDFEIAHALWAEADESDKDAYFDAMIERRGGLDDLMSGDKDNVVALNADARIEMGQGNYREAANAFERLIFIANDPSAMVYRNAAICLERIGQQGLALERLAAAVEAEPMQLDHYLAKASMEGRLRRIDEGIRTLESLPAGIQRNNEAVQEVMASLELLKRTENNTGFEGISDPVLRVIGQADNEMKAANPDRAIQLLRDVAATMDPVDVRLLISMAQVESSRGNVDVAVQLLDDALVIEPGNERIEQIRRRVAASDILELVREEALGISDDPDSREARENLFIAFNALAAQQNQIADEFEISGQLKASAEARDIASRAELEMQSLEPTILTSAPSENAGLFSIQFERASEAEDWKTLEELVDFGAARNIDSSGGDIFRSRMHLRKAVAEKAAGNDGLHAEHLQSALLASRRAIDVSPWSDNAWISLGVALDEGGKSEDAIEAFSEAYRRNPNSTRTARLYASSLVNAGDDPLTTLRVLQNAKDLLPNDAYIREEWLKAEYETGSQKTALWMRASTHRLDPSNILNKLRLAEMLVSLKPARELMLNQYGEEQYSEREWGGMSIKAQERAIETLQSQWVDMYTVIFEELADAGGLSLGQALLLAEVYGKLDRRNDSVQVLRRFIEENENDPNYVPMVISVANLLLQIDRAREAGELLLSAVPKQTASTRPIDIALGQLFVTAGDYRRALPYIQSGYEATDSPELHASLIRAMLKLRRFEQAESELKKYIGDQAPTYDSLMLQAMMAYELSAVAESKGDRSVADAAMEDYRRWLAEAREVDPSQVRPYIELIDSMLAEYSRTRNQEVLEQAAFIADSGIRLMPESDTLIVKQSEILQSQGRINEAVEKLESVLRKHAGSDELRNRLTIAYLKSGQSEKAEDLIKEAISLYPDEGQWYEALGDFYQALPEPSLVNSTMAYLNAYSMEPRRSIMLKLRSVTRTGDPWDYDALIELFSATMQTSRDPKLMGLYARALGGKGSYDRADGQLRRAYPIYRKEIELGNLSRMSIRDWYEDLFAVYANRDPEEGAELAASITEDTDEFWDIVGMSTYWGLFGESGLARAIDLQQTAVERSRTEEPDVYPGLVLMLGSYQVAHGDSEQAAESFKTIVDLNPEDPGALNNYAYILATDLAQPTEALPYAEKAAALSPNSVAILDTIATINASIGNHEKAMVSRLKQHELEPENVGVILSISNAYFDHLGDPEMGVAFAERALQIMPVDPDVLDTLGWAYYRTGKHSKGEEHIRSSIKKGPTPRAHLHMAQVFIDQGRRDKARDHLQKALDLSPDDGTRSEIERLQDDIGRG